MDRLLAYALRLRGVTILPIYCDAIQTVECNVYGGVWGGQHRFADNCRQCMTQSQRLWQDNPDPPIRLSAFTQPADTAAIDHILASLRPTGWLDYSEPGMPLGRWAKDILVNNYVVGDYQLVPNCHNLGRNHLRNLLLLKAAYARILDTIQPDCVVANDSYYGMWAVLQALCQQRRIPFYSHWPATKTRVVVAHNDAAMNLDFRSAWPKFSAQVLSEAQQQRISAWLDGQSGQRGYLIDTAVVQAHHAEEFDLARVDRSKPTALLPANVIWDLAALNKQIVFADMIDWMVETIGWFRQHPEFQLIIKAHPAEQSPALPETQERTDVALRQRGVVLPTNVFLLSPTVKRTVYDLLPLVTVGLVHTSTVGFEMVALGLPVITTGWAPYRGLGFTHDPTTPPAYFARLQQELGGGLAPDPGPRIDLARKFILLYQYHYYMRLGLFESEAGRLPTIRVSAAAELLPGHNPQLDYLVDSILAGLPIVSADRWPPES